MRSSFAWLWTGQAFSVFASSFALLAIPSVAILTLNATPLEVGALEALATIGFPVLGLPAGVWIDRWLRSRVLAVANLGRAIALVSIPIAARIGALTILWLAIVALIVGSLDVFFTIAYQAVVPEIVPTSDLPAANARLESTDSLARAVGTGGGGALVGLFGGASAVIAIALAYAASSAALFNMKVLSREGTASHARASFWRELREGLSAAFRAPAIPQLIGCTATACLGLSTVMAAYLLFIYRTLHFTPVTAGLIMVFGEVGFLGALMTPRIQARIGAIPTLISAQIGGGIAGVVMPLAAFVGPFPAKIALLITAQVLLTCSIPICNIIQNSYRQSVVPAALQGRVNATARAIIWGTLPVGSALGGLLANELGPPIALFCGGLIMLGAAAWLLTPAVAALRRRAVVLET